MRMHDTIEGLSGHRLGKAIMHQHLALRCRCRCVRGHNNKAKQLAGSHCIAQMHADARKRGRFQFGHRWALLAARGRWTGQADPSKALMLCENEPITHASRTRN